MPASMSDAGVALEDDDRGFARREFVRGVSAISHLRARLPATLIPGDYEQLPVQADAVASGRYPTFVLQGYMNHPAIPWAQWIEGHRPPLTACLVRKTPSHIGQGLPPPAAVSSCINDHMSLVRVLTGDETIHDVLDRIYRLPMSANDDTG
jgi:hypothetical protein